MPYTTATEVRARMQKTDAGDDVTITALIAAAEQAINNFCNRPDGFLAPAAASARYYTGLGKSYLLLDECVAITEVAVKDSATDMVYVAWDSPTTNMAGDGDWFAFSGEPRWPEFNRLPYDSLMVDPNGDHSVFTDGRLESMTVPTVKVTARWGYALAVPYAIKEACAMQTARWYKRLQGAMTSTLASAELGTLEIYRSLDPDIEFLLVQGRYKRPAVG